MYVAEWTRSYLNNVFDYVYDDSGSYEDNGSIIRADAEEYFSGNLGF